jgi:general secretion pathway protein L
MPTWVGIDIGQSAVKVAVVRSAYRKMSLEALAIVDVGEGHDTNAAIRDAVTAALGHPATPNEAMCVAIDGSRATIRTLEVPATAQKQLAEFLVFELEAQLPFEMSESVFDFRTLGSGVAAREDASATINVLVGVARTDDVRARIEQVKGALAVEPERVGLGALPLVNLVPFIPALSDGTAVFVLVDLGSMTSEFIALRDGEPVFVRTLSFGTLGIPATAPRLAREIRVSIAAFRAAGGAEPTRVYLCGGGAFVSGAIGFLAGELELPVEELPAPSIEMANLPPERSRDLPRFAKAVGLALGLSSRAQGLDMRRGPLAYERGFAWIREKVPVLAGLAAVIVVSFFFSAWAQLHAAGKDRDVLEKALGMVTKDVLGEETTSADRANELMDQLKAGTDEDPMPHADGFDVMVKLSEDIPQSMTHDIEELDVQKGHVVVHGIVGSIPDAQSIASSLSNEKCFSDVKVTRTNQVVGGERQKYVLEFDLKCPEDVKGAKKKEAAGAPASSSSGGGK